MSVLSRLAVIVGGENGTPASVAKAIGISMQATYKWSKTYVPEDRALEVEALSGGAIDAREVLVEARDFKETRQALRAARLEGMRKRLGL